MAVTKIWGQGQGELGTRWWQDTQFKLGGVSLSDLLCVMGLTSKTIYYAPENCRKSTGCNWPHHKKEVCEVMHVLTSSAESFTRRQELLSFTNLQGSASMAKRAWAQQTQAILRFQFCTRTAGKWFILENFTTKRGTRNNQDWRLGDTASPLGLLSQQVIVV